MERKNETGGGVAAPRTTDRWVILYRDGQEVGSSEAPIELHVVPSPGTAPSWRVVRRLDWRKGVEITGQETAARRICEMFPARHADATEEPFTRGAVIDALVAGDGDVAGRLLRKLPHRELLSLLTETVERLVRGEDDFGVRELVEEVLGDG